MYAIELCAFVYRTKYDLRIAGYGLGPLHRVLFFNNYQYYSYFALFVFGLISVEVINSIYG